MGDPPILPSISLPGQILPEPPNMPRAVLEIPRAEAPSYVPMLAPPSELRPPVGVPKEGEEEAKEEEKNEPPPPPEIQTITIPWIDHELPVPKEEIVVAAGMTAIVSVVATLTATSLFNQVVKILKPVIMQVVKRIQKKLGKDTTGSRKEEELTK